jgi:hypothetical protein
MPRIAISSGRRPGIRDASACSGANGPIVAGTALSLGLSRCDLPANLDFGGLKTKGDALLDSSRTIDLANFDAMSGRVVSDLSAG